MDHFQIPFIPKTIHFNNLMSTVKKKKSEAFGILVLKNRNNRGRNYC